MYSMFWIVANIGQFYKHNIKMYKGNIVARGRNRIRVFLITEV